MAAMAKAAGSWPLREEFRASMKLLKEIRPASVASSDAGSRRSAQGTPRAGPPGGGDAHVVVVPPGEVLPLNPEGDSVLFMAGGSERGDSDHDSAFGAPSPSRNAVDLTVSSPVRSSPPSPGLVSVASSMSMMKRALSSQKKVLFPRGAPGRNPKSAEALGKAPTVPAVSNPPSIAERARQARSQAVGSDPTLGQSSVHPSSSTSAGAGASILSFTPEQLRDILVGVHAGASSSSDISALVEELRQGRMASERPAFSTFPPAPRSVLPNALLPPAGFEMPPYGEFSAVASPGLPPLKPGCPLAGLSAGVSAAHVEHWSAEYSKVARQLREYLIPKGASLSHWKMQSPPVDLLAESLPPSSLEGPAADQPVDPKVDGFPITPDCERVIAKVAYASSGVSRKQGWAREVKVAETDYRRCLDWDLHFAPHEAAPLCAESAISERKDPRIVVSDACFRGEDGKKVLADLNERLWLGVDSLKCSVATNAAMEGGAYLVADLTSSAQSLDSAVNAFLRDAVDAGVASAELLTDPQFVAIREEFTRLRQHLASLTNVVSIVDHASKAGTDSAARTVRNTVQDARAATTRAVLGEKSSDSAAQRATQGLPVVPGSLFGGRWYSAVSSLASHRKAREQLHSFVKSSAGASSLISAGEKRPAEVPPPFRGHGGPPAPKAPKTATTDSASQSKGGSSLGNRPATKTSSSKPKSTHSSSKGGKKGGSSKSSGGGGKRSAPSSAKGKSAEKQGDKQ